MSTIVVTDLTRMSGNQICLAGLTPDGRQSVRPIFSGSHKGYLTDEICQKRGILPGTILSGPFKAKADVERPHTEDHWCWYDNFYVYARTTGEIFQTALQFSARPVLTSLFDSTLSNRSFPDSSPPSKSLATLLVNPSNFELAVDSNGKLRANLSDLHSYYSDIPVTDLGYFNFFKRQGSDITVINNFIRSQTHLFLRVGLTREYLKRFWLQINGIYTFPSIPNEIREHCFG